VSYAFDLLMKQLHIKHSEVRLSVYQMTDELFQRSHKFRELLLEDFQAFIALTTGKTYSDLHIFKVCNIAFIIT